MNQNPKRPAQQRRPVRRPKPAQKKARKPIKHFYLKSAMVLVAGGLIIFGIIKYMHYNSSRSYLVEAQDLLDKGEETWALRYANNALHFDPEYIDAYIFKARLLMRWKKYYDCKNNIESAFKYSEEPTPEMHYLLGVSYYKEGTFKNALKHLKVAYESEPEKDSLAYFIGDIYHKTELNYTQAVQYYKPFFNRNRNSVKTALRLGDCYYASDDYKLAIDHYNIVLKINDTNPKALTGIAKCYFKNEKTKDLGCESAMLASKYGSEDAQILVDLNCQTVSDTLNTVTEESLEY